MSTPHLSDWLDAGRIADMLANDEAIRTELWWRIEANWSDGQGGFAYSLPFATYADALTWGKHKARGHADAVVTVTPSASAADRALADGFAGAVPFEVAK